MKAHHQLFDSARWRQEDIIYDVLSYFDEVPMTAQHIAHYLELKHYPRRKYHLPTIRTVLSRLACEKKIRRVGVGLYQAKGGVK